MPENRATSEREQLERIYHEQGSRLRNFFRFSVGNREAADDLTQETFLQLWRRGVLCDPERGGINAYVIGIARKKAADWWRKNKPHTSDAIQEQGAPAVDAIAIRDALNHLPHDLRSILWLREVEGYSYEELSSAFKIPVGTVRSRLHSARQQLRNIWTRKDSQ